MTVGGEIPGRQSHQQKTARGPGDSQRCSGATILPAKCPFDDVGSPRAQRRSLRQLLLTVVAVASLVAFAHVLAARHLAIVSETLAEQFMQFTDLVAELLNLAVEPMKFAKDFVEDGSGPPARSPRTLAVDPFVKSPHGLAEFLLHMPWRDATSPRPFHSVPPTQCLGRLVCLGNSFPQVGQLGRPPHLFAVAQFLRAFADVFLSVAQLPVDSVACFSCHALRLFH